MNKKAISVIIISIFAVVIFLFILFKAFSFIKLKNECIEKNTNQGGHSVTIYLDTNSSQEKIDNFINKIKDISGVEDVSSKTSDDALNEFKKENENNKQILDQINNLPKNPLKPSVRVNSKITNIAEFLKLEAKLKNEAIAEDLIISSIEDGRIIFFQEQLGKVEEASLIKGLPIYLFSTEPEKFFGKRYSPICNSNFPK